jgi:hypothetical protein
VLAFVDHLVRVPKTIFGKASWKDSKGTGQLWVLKAQLAINGDTQDGLQIDGRIWWNYRGRGMQLAMSYNHKPIERLAIGPILPHTNGVEPWVPSELQKLRFSAGDNRYYAWENNRQWPQPIRNLAAIPVDQDLLPGPAAITYMFDRLRITGDIPDLPQQTSLLS